MNGNITTLLQQITDANGNRTAVEFDALGRVTAQAVMGKAPSDPDYPGYEEGDSLAVPGTTFAYDLQAFEQSGTPASVTVVKRETHIHSPNANNETLKEVSYHDGLGNELQKRVQFDAGDGVAVTGRQIVNNKGLVVVQYEPYLDSGYEYSENTPPRAAKVKMTYDVLNRLVRTDFDDGTFTKVEFNAWQQKEYDQNDTVLDSQWYADRGSPDPSGPEPSDPEERAAWLAAKAYNTPRVLELDPLGRMFLRRNDNGSDNAPIYYDTRFELDITGRKRKVIDARGLETFFTPSLLPLTKEIKDRTVYENGPDSGKRWLLPDIMGKPSYSWDERGYRQRMEYDVAQRPVEKWVIPPSGSEVLKEIMVYGKDAPNARIDNLLGQIFEQYDQAGKQSFTKYDFKGNLKEEQRRFAQVFDEVLDYNGSVPLNAETYTTAYDHDALNRPTEKITPDNSTTKYAYSKNALLQSQTVDVRGGGTDENAITDIKYDAKGQRTDIYYANGSKTKYEYDPATFRVTRILTTRNTGADILQDLSYVYDAAGNITQQKDDAQQTIYFANQVVPPVCKYTYDSLYRLKKATGRELNGLNQPSHTDCPIQTPVPDTETNACRNYTQNYQYDELGNILQMQHIAQNGNWTRNYYYPTTSNRLVSHTSGQTDYTYDEAGNMLSMPHLNTMVWNEDNMPVEIDLGGGGTAYYRYDVEGNRVRKVIVNGNSKKERLYISDWEVWRQSTSGTIQTERETLHISDQQKRFLQLETLIIDNGIPVSNPTTNWRYQYDNSLESACLELDSNAAVISYEEYFPFGSTSYRSGKSQSEVKLKRYRFTGKERDSESGLYYYGARYYASWLGRFISTDLLKNDYPQLTPYNYAGNKPVTYKDLDGLQATGDDEVKQDRNIEIKPRDEYEAEILSKDKSIMYTENYGWVDTTHAFTPSDNPIISAFNLWSQILNEEGIKSNTPTGEEGYKVTYRQEADVFGLNLGVTKSYFVKTGLSIKEKEQVALAIFQEVSIEFEKFQAFGILIGRGDSTFEPADLPSNMLGFYSAVRGMSEEKIMELINPLSAEQSIAIYRQYPGTFTDKRFRNYSFNPKFFPNKFSPLTPKVPKELQGIKPALKDELFRDWMPLFDVYGGKPPIMGLKY